MITGFGRLGTWFASDYYGIKPNMITFAKAVTSGYIPLCGLLIDDRIVDALMATTTTSTTATPSRAIPWPAPSPSRTSRSWSAKTSCHGQRLQRPALAKMLAKFKDHPLVGEVRSVGMLGAIELVADKRTRRRFDNPGRVGLICRDHFFREGFIMRAVFDTMVCAPPLIWGDASSSRKRNASSVARST